MQALIFCGICRKFRRYNIDVGTLIENAENISNLRGKVHLINHVHISEPYLKPIERRALHKDLAQLRMGIWWALQRGYEGIITIDGNNKGSIEDVPRFIEKLNEGYELLAYLSVRASQLGFKACEIPVTREYPPAGKTPTKISFFKGNFNLMKVLLKNLFGAYN